MVHEIAPESFRIPGVTPDQPSPVVPKPQFYGVNPQTGEKGLQFGMPDTLEEVSWWNADPQGILAPKPGGPVGNAYIALLWGHTGLSGRTGVFKSLSKVAEGDLSYLSGVDAKGIRGTLTLRAIKALDIPKSPQRLFDDTLANEAPPNTRVVTSTCTGDVDAKTGHHVDLRVVMWDIIAWMPA